MKNKLNNLLSFNDFTGELPSNKQKKTKRTDVGLDIINEKNIPLFNGIPPGPGHTGSIRVAHFDDEELDLIFGSHINDDTDSDNQLIEWEEEGRIFFEGNFLWAFDGDRKVIKYIKKNYPESYTPEDEAEEAEEY